MSVIEKLRQNDPERTRIRIRLHDEPSDADLAQGLAQNPFVTEIILSLEDVQQADWNSLLRVIAMQANLDTVRLQDAYDGEERTAPAGLVRAFLQAIQQNTAIRFVKLWWLRLPTNISTVMDNMSSVTSFSLYKCDMEPSEREQGAMELAAALQQNTSITNLRVDQLDDIYTVPILEGLQINTSVKTFIFTFPIFLNISDATSHAIQQLLESTTSIQRFELQHQRFRGESLFRPVAQGIIKSECVSELKLSDCEFEDRESFAQQLQSILQNKQNLKTLCLDFCDFGRGQVHGDIISMLSRPDSLLRCFEFQSTPSHGSLETVFPRIPFEALLRAIEKSKLERFSIGRIETPHQLQTLMQSIPLMRIRELEVSFWGQILRENANPRQNLLLAIKNNFSLRSVKAKMLNEGSDLFDSAEDKQTLAFYANRNEHLDQWVDHPETVEQQRVWPEALSLAERAGPNALFRGLRSVLERDYVSLPSGRMRKRPQCYTPA